MSLNLISKQVEGGRRVVGHSYTGRCIHGVSLKHVCASCKLALDPPPKMKDRIETKKPTAKRKRT